MSRERRGHMPLLAGIEPAARHAALATRGRARIAYVTPRYAPFAGGVETHVEHLALRAVTHGYEVEVLTQDVGAGLDPVEEIDGVTVRRFRAIPLGATCLFAPGLWTYLARHRSRYALVHAHSYHALPALGAALAGCRRLIFTPHYHGAGHSPLRRALHAPYRVAGAAIFRRADRIICVSAAEAALVRRHFPFVSGRLTIIPNGVDAPALRRAEPFDHEPPTILSVGRLEEYKNVHRVVAALAHLGAAVVLRVIGEGPARPGLERLATRLGVAGRVAFLGRVDDATLYRWFRTANVYVSMSDHEAFGLTLLEAVAGGAYVVAADIPAYREVAARVAPGAITLSPVGADAPALAAAIACALRRPRQESGGPMLSWDDVAAQTLSLYRAMAPVPGRA